MSAKNTQTAVNKWIARATDDDDPRMKHIYHDETGETWGGSFCRIHWIEDAPGPEAVYSPDKGGNLEPATLDPYTKRPDFGGLFRHENMTAIAEAEVTVSALVLAVKNVKACYRAEGKQDSTGPCLISFADNRLQVRSRSSVVYDADSIVTIEHGDTWSIPFGAKDREIAVTCFSHDGPTEGMAIPVQSRFVLDALSLWTGAKSARDTVKLSIWTHSGNTLAPDAWVLIVSGKTEDGRTASAVIMELNLAKCDKTEPVHTHSCN